MRIGDLDPLGSIGRSLRPSLQEIGRSQRAIASLQGAYTLDLSLRAALDARKAIESSLANQLDATLRVQRDALRIAALGRSLKSVLANHNTIATSLANQLEASARAQREALRNIGLERSLTSVLEAERSVKASLASQLDASRLKDRALLQTGSIPAIQIEARQREMLAASLRALNSFASQSLSSFLTDRRVLPSESLGFLQRSVSSALGGWGPAIGEGFVRDLQSALASQVSEESPISIVDAVTEAVGEAIQRNPSRTDWKFVITLVISILIFLYQEEGTKENQRVFRAAVADIQERLLSQEDVLQLLLTREVRRSTRLFSRPSSKSRYLMRIEQGTVVIVLDRRNKWTRIGLRSASPDTRTSPIGGWMLNKYLK